MCPSPRARPSKEQHAQNFQSLFSQKSARYKEKHLPDFTFSHVVCSVRYVCKRVLLLEVRSCFMLVVPDRGEIFEILSVT